MIAEVEVIARYLPASIGIIVAVVSAGLMGLFRSIALNKKSYDDTVESLQRQLEVIKAENELLRQKKK